MAPGPSPTISSACSLHSCPDIPKSISSNPRIQALLKCNCPLLETDRVSLLATVSESSELLSVLKEKIDHAQQMLNALLDGQAKVAENLQAAKTLLHPIRSIPDDVLRHVFSFCVHDVYDILEEDHVPNSLGSRKPPWTLSQVCRSWRRVSLSTASLWRCLSIDFEQYREPKDVHLHQFMLGLHIQRARQCQLTIRLSSVNDISSHAFIPILLTSIPHWKHLRTCIPAKSLAVLSTYGSYLEGLHYLQIGLPEAHAASPIHAFEMARSLRILDIHSTLCRHIYLPDGGKVLTKLVIHGPFVNHIFSFLRKTPHIQELELHFVASKSFERLSSPIMMPKLTSLVISEWDGAAHSSIAHLFESLELPTLSILQVTLDNEDNSTNFVFPEMLPHHHCRGITALIVTAPSSKVGKPGLINFLTQFSNLAHLTVSAKIVDNDLLLALTRSKDNDDILPELRTFNLQGSKSIPEHRLFLQMAESRMKDETEDDEGDNKDEEDEAEDEAEDEEDEAKAEDETEDDDEGDNEGEDEGNDKDADQVKEGVMLQEVYLDGPLTFDDPSLASRWQALQRNGLIVKYED
ncbi:uncharacterized protein ARMOST_06412 [Armillaria ostoyae]|uniref:Uncharacterized protein n=1 Tax=Armillaria ostoyae TaxID=47428 RepID=A0A284R2W2_ARMOS|nr:uncharacterized protein ARMOST_06412 [Armillaria ostoyae]